MNKEEFIAKANLLIKEVSIKINELESRNVSANNNSKTKYDNTFKDLESKKTDLISKYFELKIAEENKREKVQDTWVNPLLFGNF